MLKDYEIKYRRIFSVNLNRMLELYDKTKAELAQYLNVSRVAVANWCRGISDPRMDKLDKICDFFGCSRNDLMNEQPGVKYFDEVKKSGQESWYYDDEAAAAAQFLYENPEYKVLFDASRKIKKEDIELVRALLDKMKSEEEPY